MLMLLLTGVDNSLIFVGKSKIMKQRYFYIVYSWYEFTGSCFHIHEGSGFPNLHEIAEGHFSAVNPNLHGLKNTTVTFFHEFSNLVEFEQAAGLRK